MGYLLNYYITKYILEFFNNVNLIYKKMEKYKNGEWRKKIIYYDIGDWNKFVWQSPDGKRIYIIIKNIIKN